MSYQLPKPITLVFDFPGLSGEPRLQINQATGPGAAAEQNNCCSLIQGELLVRRGFREIVFEPE